MRVSDQDGVGLIELLVATTVIAIALLALVAGYDSAAISLHNSARKTTASALANQQMELYRALPFSDIGLDETTTADIGDSANAAYDSVYATNSVLDGAWVTDPTTNVQYQLPSGTVNDVTISGCGTSPQCSPIQDVTGPDNHEYRVETFIVDEANSTGIRWTERVVTVVVRDAQVSGEPEILQLTSGFDRGPSS